MEIQFALSDIDQAAQQFWTGIGSARVFAFHAPMGTGKTTFIAALCRAKGVVAGISSPTFSLINEYETQSGSTLYHIDLYRLRDAEEALQAGVEDVLHSEHICFVEWPEKAPGILPDDTLHIRLDIRPLQTPAGVVDSRYLCTFTSTSHESA